MENNLPKGWDIKKLVEHIPIVKTGVREYKGEKPYYSTGAVANASISPEGYYSFKKKPSRANRLVLKGDVVQARMQGTTKALLVDENLEGSLFSTGFLQFRPSEYSYDSKLFYHYLCSDLFLKQRDEFASGSTQIALTDKGASKIDLVVPPPDQQKRIADKLDSLLARVKDAQSRLDTIPTILNRFRQSVLAAAFSKELTKTYRKMNKIDDTWELSSIEPLLSKARQGMKTGPFGTALKKSEHIKEGVPVLGIENISEEGFVDGNKIFITKEKAKELNKFDLHHGDIIISRSGTVGEICVVPNHIKEARMSTNLIRVTLDENVIDPYYFAYLFKGSQLVFNKLKELCSGSTRDFLNQKILKLLKFPLPSLKEQREIVRRINQNLIFMKELKRRFIKTKNYLDKLQQSILAKAFRGELVPECPNDEPAEVLLGKIKISKQRSCNYDKKHTKKSRSL